MYTYIDIEIGDCQLWVGSLNLNVTSLSVKTKMELPTMEFLNVIFPWDMAKIFGILSQFLGLEMALSTYF